MVDKARSCLRRKWKPDLSKMRADFTEEEIAAAVARVEAESKAFNARDFVAHIKSHPKERFHWNAGIMSFDEYVRRVEAGEFD